MQNMMHARAPGQKWVVQKLGLSVSYSFPSAELSFQKKTQFAVIRGDATASLRTLDFWVQSPVCLLVLRHVFIHTGDLIPAHTKWRPTLRHKNSQKSDTGKNTKN